MQKFYEGLKSSFLDWTSNISADDQGYWSPYVSFFQLSIPDSLAENTYDWFYTTEKTQTWTKYVTGESFRYTV